MGRKPTMYDVAERAGVSIATVSFAFAQPGRVRPSTREAVLAAAAALGYVPNANARGLARGRTGAIGLYAFDYLLDLTEPADVLTPNDARLFPQYADEVQRGVELECRVRGLALMLGAGTPQTALPGDLGVPRVVDIAGRVDGLIAFAGAAPSDALTRIAGRIPVVELGGMSTAEGTRTVVVDNTTGMRGLVEHLLHVHRHREFRYIGDSRTAEFDARYAAYAATLAGAGVAALPPAHSAPGAEETTRAAVGDLLAADALPHVIVCSTDQEALVALDALRDNGVAVPGRVAVTGFDGIVAAGLSTPGLTTVQQPMQAVGRTAVRLLTGEITEQSAPLPTALVLRQSCGCA
ncbi:LacI family DNA-binding transcriptional regulator [Actinokineospora guangxiensis]|uniref:LacI family DNA-binding transcriptional regulator n=1 Tax=Actinokineospora guangxiensis TaxID=1490288 RepID=A0ABW0EG71_9PSEU